MKSTCKERNKENLDKKTNISKDDIIKSSDDFCIINGEKIEGNSCSTIINNK